MAAHAIAASRSCSQAESSSRAITSRLGGFRVARCAQHRARVSLRSFADGFVGLLPFALYALHGVSAGVLIGCVGIGGVILVPILVYVAAVPLPTAIAAAMCAFLVSGLVGVYVFAKAGTVDRKSVV